MGGHNPVVTRASVNFANKPIQMDYAVSNVVIQQEAHV